MISSKTNWPTYEKAEAAAFERAAISTGDSGWVSANVFILLGTHEGPLPKREKCIRVDVLRHDERAPDELVAWHEFYWKKK